MRGVIYRALPSVDVCIFYICSAIMHDLLVSDEEILYLDNLVNFMRVMPPVHRSFITEKAP